MGQGSSRQRIAAQQFRSKEEKEALIFREMMKINQERLLGRQRLLFCYRSLKTIVNAALAMHPRHDVRLFAK